MIEYSGDSVRLAFGAFLFGSVLFYILFCSIFLTPTWQCFVNVLAAPGRVRQAEISEFIEPARSFVVYNLNRSMLRCKMNKKICKFGELEI